MSTNSQGTTRVLSAPPLYRKLPALSGGYDSSSRDGYPAGREGRCARLTGHTLIVKGDRIECQSCGATWRDEGF